MRDRSFVSVIIPALNEAGSIANVLADIPEWVDEVIVADNGSTDGTPGIAEEHGARVVHEKRRGYGSACLRAIAALDAPDVVVFLDADYSDFPDQMDRLVDPIVNDEVDMVIGSRVRGNAARGALTPQARFGNRLACFLMRMFWGVRYSDLGPFRAIRYGSLQQLGMADPDYGWTVEMQIKAALQGIRTKEVPVDYRKRIGRSKVSGTLRGVIGAGYKILSTIFISAAKHYLTSSAGASSSRLIIFTRYPTPGSTKTRLVPALGDKGAADLQRSMTEHAVAVAKRSNYGEIEVCYTGSSASDMLDWLGEGLRYRAQSDGDLGERMAGALTSAFGEGADRAVIIGIDSPEISSGIHREAVTALATQDVVLGPATDGGYYLIGVRKSAAQQALAALLQGIEWGTDRVLSQTLTSLDSAGLSVRLLVPLDDIDRPEDLCVWDRAKEDDEPGEETPRISVIIPALNEAERINATVMAAGASEVVEVIVVDADSDDETVAIAESAGARVYTGPLGRAEQMNLGSAKARGKILLFLHADTLLPEGYDSLVLDAISSAGAVAGAFEFSTNETFPLMHMITYVTNLRSRWLGLPYGDQGIFLEKERFRAMGGFKAMPIMEDFELVRRLARQGRMVIVPAKAVTCARRWRNLGAWRTTLLNQTAITMYYLRVSPERIAAFYDRRRGLR